MAQNFETIISNRVVGANEVQAQAEAMRKLAESISGLTEKANDVNKHPGFSKFAENVKQGIENPLQAAGAGAETFLKALGPLGTGVAVAAATFGTLLKVSADAARELGHYGDELSDTATRMGLTVKETAQFSFAMKTAGGDIGTLQGIMRKLSSEVEDGGKNLRAIGVEYRELGTGKIRPTSAIVLELSERLKSMPDVFARNAAAVKIFGRSALEVLPDLMELAEGYKRAGQLGIGPSEDDIRRWAQYERQMAEIDYRWEELKRRMKEPIAAVITFFFQDTGGKQYTLEELRQRGVNLGQWAPHTAYGDRQAAAAAGFHQPAYDTRNALDAALGYTGQIEERRRVDAAIDRMTNSRTLEAQLKAAEKALGDLSVPTKGASSRKDVDDYAAAQRKVESLKAQIEATKKLKEEQEQLDKEIKSFAENAAQAELSAGEKILQQRDKLIEQAQKLGRAESVITSLKANAITGTQALATKALADFDRWDLGGTATASKSGAERMRDTFGPGGFLNPFFGWDSIVKEVERSQQEATELRNISVGSTRGEIMARSGRTLSMMQFGMGPGQEAAAIVASYQERLRLARELYTFENSSAQNEVERARALADFNRARYDASIEHELKLAELQRRRIEELRGMAGDFFDAMLGGGDGIRQFGMNQLRGLGRAAFGNTITSLATKSKITAASTFGGTWLGDMFGGGNPLKLSTDQNTMATIENTAALRSLAISPSGGGGGYSSALSTFANMRFGGGGPVEYSEDGVPIGNALPTDYRGGWGWQRTAGVIGAGAGAGFGIYSGIRQGGGRGALTASGSALAGAGAIMALASKSLSWAGPVGMLAGMGLGMLTSLFGDPKQERAESLDRERMARAYYGGTGTEYTTDIYGRSVEYAGGGMRPVVVYQTNHIQAIDGPNLQQHLIDHPEAVSVGIVNAITTGNGEDVLGTIRQNL